MTHMRYLISISHTPLGEEFFDAAVKHLTFARQGGVHFVPKHQVFAHMPERSGGDQAKRQCFYFGVPCIAYVCVCGVL